MTMENPVSPSSLSSPVENKSSAGDCIRVITRCRPLNDTEKNRRDKNVIHVDASKCDSVKVTIAQGTTGARETLRHFQFNYCAMDVPQHEFFHVSGILPLLDSAIQGYAATVFAYGQTGAGKTFTMSGVEERLGAQDASKSMIDDPTSGIIPRALDYLFTSIAGLSTPTVRYTVKASYCEIYNEQVYDLLNATQEMLHVRWNESNGFYVQSLLVVECESIDDIMAVVEEGHRNRRVGSHDLNKDSSRSHSLMTVYIDCTRLDETEAENLQTFGKISFVDLAGSERLKDSRSSNAGETSSINTSLFTLGKVISQLSAGSSFIPYRDSKLTKLLMDSLGGQSLTLMIACISPAGEYLEETLSTLNYATRANNIRNRPVIQVDAKAQLVYTLKRENAQLRVENQELRRQLESSSGRLILPDINEPPRELNKSSQSPLVAQRMSRLQPQYSSIISSERRYEQVVEENIQLSKKIEYLEQVFVGQPAPPSDHHHTDQVNDELRQELARLTNENRGLRAQDKNDVPRMAVATMPSNNIPEGDEERLRKDNEMLQRRVAHLQTREKELMKALARKTRTAVRPE